MIHVLQPLRPQSRARVTWECKVVNMLANRLDCCHGDAAGFMDVHTAEVDALFEAGARPWGAAEILASIDQGE